MDKISIQQRAEVIFNNLDTADGKVDKKISASVWNEFAETAGGNKIKEFIDEKDAMKSIKAYLKRSDASKQSDMFSKAFNLAKMDPERKTDGQTFNNAISTIRELENKYGKYFKNMDARQGGPTGGLIVWTPNKEKIRASMTQDERKIYDEAKKTIEELKQKYNCKDELGLETALLIEVKEQSESSMNFES